MARIVTIKPKPNSKKFFSTANQYQKQKGNDGVVRDVNAGAFKGERFPNSRQMFRPLYSQSKRRWLLQGHDVNSEELNKLVKGCKLKVTDKKSSAYGNYITEADVFDYSDPFFTHKLLRITSKEGEVSLDKERPLDQIILMGCQASPKFQSGVGNNSILSARVKYVITDSDIENKLRREVHNVKREAYKLFEALNFEKKKKIALIMGVIVSAEKADPDLLDSVLFEAADNDKAKIGKQTKQEFFIDLCKVDSEELDFKHMIVMSKKGGHLRKRKTGFELFGNYVGKTMKEVENHLRHDDNQDVLVRLTQILEE